MIVKKVGHSLLRAEKYLYVLGGRTENGKSK